VNSTLAKILKGVAGVIVLLVLFSTINRWWGEYRSATTESAIGTTTSTAPPAGEGEKEPVEEPAGEGESKPATKTVVVLTEGLNFRVDPSRDAKVIRGLGKGEEVTLLKTENGWHQVQTEDGTRGWISADSTYSEVR
jgi:uncharacterized protein YgiM (DUF1202 family)